MASIECVGSTCEIECLIVAVQFVSKYYEMSFNEMFDFHESKTQTHGALKTMIKTSRPLFPLTMGAAKGIRKCNRVPCKTIFLQTDFL